MKHLILILPTVLLFGCGQGSEKPLTPLAQQYQHPYQFIGKPVNEVSKALATQANDVGNIIIEEKPHKLLLESNNNFISYVDIDFQETIPCSIKKILIL
ncbi:MAG: hypothetical protein OQK09_13740 [Colwellia sp.]|nr:hypothetical protein [Colwellia sp.]MCW9082569.1 hypothetical protein [Colwellia sp.]